MKKLMMLCFAFIMTIGFVVAVSSEVSTNFVVDRGASVVDDSEFVFTPSFWDSYGTQVIAIVVVLIVLYVLFKAGSKKKPKKRVGKKAGKKSKKRK